MFGEVYRLASIFGDPNVFAAFLSAAIPFLLFAATALGDRRGRRLAIVAAAVLLIPLWLSFSRGGWVGAVAGFVAAAALIDRRALRLGVVLMVVTFAIAWLLPRDLLGGEGLRPDLFDATFGRFGMIGQGADLRTQFIHNALPIVQDHSLLGVGPGRYGGAVAHLFGTPVYHRYATDLLFINPAQHTVDDFWLHLLVESGAVGFGSFVAMIGAVLLPVARAARRAFGVRRLLLSGIAAATVCLAVNSLSTMMLEANGVGFVFWFLLGLGSLLVAGEDHRRDPERERHGP
jgi:O-antigen ligase